MATKYFFEVQIFVNIFSSVNIYCITRSLPLLPGDVQQKLSILLQVILSSDW